MEQDARMLELETRLMYQERTITELGELVAAQEGRIRRLEDALRSVASRVKDLSEDKSPLSMPHERPPHY